MPNLPRTVCSSLKSNDLFYIRTLAKNANWDHNSGMEYKAEMD
jgi:hypothetical protein